MLPRAFVFSALLAACSSGDRTTVGDAAPAPLAIADAAPPPADAAALPIDHAARLREGRRLAQEEEWREALVALDDAAAGGDPRALAELGFTAILAGDVVRAEAASRALLAREGASAETRATAHYHLGRAAELRGDLDGAREAYDRSLALKRSAAVADREDRLAPRPPLLAPPAPPCAEPRATGELCACLAAALGIESPPRCVDSHQHTTAFVKTVVARDRAPTFLIAPAGKGRARVLAELGGAEITITGWRASQDVVRVDVRRAPSDERAWICRTGDAARCLAVLPIVEEVGTPAALRRLDVTLENRDSEIMARVTIVEGPPLPADRLGEHTLR